MKTQKIQKSLYYYYLITNNALFWYDIQKQILNISSFQTFSLLNIKYSIFFIIRGVIYFKLELIFCYQLFLLDGTKYFSTSSNLSIDPSFSRRLEKDEWFRTFCKSERTSSFVTPCLIS